MRYFIVFISNDETSGTSIVPVANEDYPNLNLLMDNIKKQVNTAFSITNIIELNKTDFNRFIE